MVSATSSTKRHDLLAVEEQPHQDGDRQEALAVQDQDPTSLFAQVITPRKKTQASDYQATKDSSSTDAADKTRPTQLVSLRTMFSFADAKDWLLMGFGTLCAMAAGVGQPIQVLLFGDVINDFNPAGVYNSSLTSDQKKQLNHDIMHSIEKTALKFLIVGVLMFFACFCQVACFSITASRQAKRIRAAYMQAIVAKDIGWFDVNEPMQLATKVADSTVTIQEGIGRKIGDSINFGSMALGGFIIGFIKGWELALVVMAFSPFLAGAAYLSMKVMANAVQGGIESYGRAGGIAQEALSNARTVQMFNSIKIFVKKYDDALQDTVKAGIRKGIAVGWGTGSMFFFMLCTYAGGMYFGAVKVADDVHGDHPCTGHGCYSGGQIMTVFFSVIMSAMGLGQAAPGIQAFFAARAAAYDAFDVINSGSVIDPLSNHGKKLDKVEGKVALHHVRFAYPSRPSTLICDDYSLEINSGETVALVGPSGSGKSTIVSLLERFYDPIDGQVLLDDVDIRELNVRWLRQQIGFVGQEPVLFATSIMENIRNGDLSATDEQVREAARQANAYNFIMEFPAGFATEVGERGTQLSGGQKQRIAIARAIIKNPAVLLLDEATSALDTESERIVQESLDNLLKTSRRTTIIIAHRLSTIRNADRIAVHKDGKIVELGNHKDLMRVEGGLYRRLVEAQRRMVNDASGEAQGSEDVKVQQGEHQSSNHKSSHSLPRVKNHVNHDHRTSKTGYDGGERGEIENSVAVSRIWKLTLPEWKFLLLGSVSAVVSAAIFPVWGVFLTKVTMLLVDTSLSRGRMLYEARCWSAGFVALGVLYGLSSLGTNYSFAVVSQKLIAKVRLLTFESMLRQEIGWFDKEENISGALVARLATDTAVLQSMTTSVLNQLLQNVTSLAIGFAISLYYSWQMTLGLLASLPVLILSATVQAQVIAGTNNNKEINDADTYAGSILSEAIEAIRTVASFGLEEIVHRKYASYLGVSAKFDVKAGCVGGVAFGISQGVMFLNVAFLFWIGGLLTTHNHITFEEMYMVLIVIMFSTFAMGIAAQDAGNVAKSKKAAANVFAVMDRVPAIDCENETSGQILPAVQGNIEFQSVDFAYPSRPNSQVYKAYSLRIPEGKTVALVGASGSGKSTAISLMERFYDPLNGRVLLDGKDLRELNVCWLRDRISLVSQEPVLFAGTIAENIALGKPNGATRQEVIEAAKMANADSFIRTFPDGYDTQVGDRGAQVSGGQKQRIAIARAILHDPQVLLLDEATSALDNESERIVQESLDRLVALKKRTTVIVAHRLSTIRNADIIAVTSDGHIVELGSHEQLMRIPNGVYKILVASQNAS